MNLTLTERAACEVKRIITEKELGDAAVLRVGVAAGGCSGFEYKLDFDQLTEEGDIVEELHGVRIAVDKKSADILGSTEIDFKDDLMSRTFVFNNPMAIRTCGCGNSFSA